jgi:hypothetical protein
VTHPSRFVLQLEAISKIGFWVNPPEADKNRGGREDQTGGILPYFEDLRPTINI